MAALQGKCPELEHSDLRDALTCALVAWLFHCRPDDLVHPGPDVPMSEGWIFVPADALA
ncbi:hypothetical protein D3C78_1313540 [compost metagenome]